MRLAFLPLLVATAAVAQADPSRFAPADSLAVVRWQWGSRWTKELGPTRIGKALADAPFVAALQQAMTPLAEVMPAPLTDFLKGLPGALEGYDGEVVAALRLDPATLAKAMRDNRPPAMAAVLALGPDGDTDLEALAQKLNALLPREGAVGTRLADRDVDVHHFDMLQVSTFAVRDGCVVAVAGLDLATQGEWFLAPSQPPIELSPEARRAIVSAHLELGGLMKVVPDLLPDMRLPAEAVQSLWRLYGIGTLRGGGFLLRAVGDRTEQEAWLDFDDGERGLFDVVLPARTARPALLRFLPAGTRSFTSRPFDPRALQSLYTRTWAALGDAVPMPRDQFEAEFTRMLKVRLDEDLLALLGDEYLSILDLGLVVDPDAEEQDAVTEKVDEKFGDTCYVIALRDGQRFQKSLETALRARGLHAGRKSEEYAGTKLHRLKVLGAFPIEYAVTDTFLVIGVGAGEGTARNVRGVLDAAAAVGNGASGTPLPDDVAAMMTGLPEGHCGVDATSLLEAIDGMLANFATLETMLAGEGMELADVEGPWAELVAVSKPLRKALSLHRADLGVTVLLSGKRRATYVTRL